MDAYGKQLNHKIVSKRIQNEFMPLTSWIALIGSIASFICVVIFLINKVGVFFVQFNLIVGCILFLIVIYRKKLNIIFNTIAVTSIIIIHSCITLYKSGFIGTGIITLLLAQVFVLVFLNLRLAIIISTGTITIMGIFGSLVFFDAVHYDYSVFKRMTSISQWIVIIIGASVFFAVSSLIITYLKKRLINNIIELEESNLKLERSSKSIEHLAYYDSLTGLPNRFNLKEKVQSRISNGIKTGTLILINIRGFRLINSLYGSDQGDNILIHFSKKLSEYLKNMIFSARLDSDEFAVWMEDYDIESLKRNITKLKNYFEHNTENHYQGPRIGFYTSASIYPDNGNNYSDCLKKASIALKYAQVSNSNIIYWFKNSMIEKIEKEILMQDLLEKSIEKNAFTVVYQNKYNIITKKVVGVEALARWETKELGKVSPEEFIPLLNKKNLIIPFTEVIFKKIISEIPILKEKLGNQIHVSINISPIVFFWPGFENFIISNLKKAQIDFTEITLEITEDIFIERTEYISAIIKRLKKTGLSISLDDFGKGFSSLYHIKYIDIDELKIDKAFINNICLDKKSFNLFKSVCSIATSLGCSIVAEGVENKEQINKLIKTDCKIVQGYYYSRPEPLS